MGDAEDRARAAVKDSPLGWYLTANPQDSYAHGKDHWWRQGRSYRPPAGATHSLAEVLQCAWRVAVIKEVARPLSQTTIADRCNLTATTVGNMLRGQSFGSDESWAQLLVVCQVRLTGELIADDELPWVKDPAVREDWHLPPQQQQRGGRLRNGPAAP